MFSFYFMLSLPHCRGISAYTCTNYDYYNLVTTILPVCQFTLGYCSNKIFESLLVLDLSLSSGEGVAYI